MGALLLNTDTVIMCPHGGMVHHSPAGYTSYRVDGRMPMLLGDVFTVAGCPNYIGRPCPCIMVQWTSASPLLVVRGRPALTLSSVGICIAVNGTVQGPAIISYTQTGQREPDQFTNIPN